MDAATLGRLEDAIDALVRAGADPSEVREWMLEALRRAVEDKTPVALVIEDETTRPNRPRAKSRVRRRST